MKLLILILIIIILIIYSICYYIFPTDISIYQADIEKFDISLLSSRQPIVIVDYLQNPEDIIKCWFKYNIINFNNDINNNDWKHNNHKYLLINAIKDTEIIIYKAQITKTNPTPNDKIIIIKLKENQSLILPFKWKYYGNNVNIWNIDDIITFSLGQFF